MNKQANPDRASHILATLNQYKAYWILPAMAGVMFAVIYAIALRQETWSAKQSLKLRDDLLGQSYKPGQFNSTESMKSAQETIFEISRQPQVIRNALQELGPPASGLFGLGSNVYPSEETIEDIQGAISFSAPNGAEFGKTEVIILNSKASSRERSKKFIDLLVREIISKVNEVRHRKFQSMEVELRQTCKAAEDSLEASKVELKKMYRLLGQDAGGISSIGDSTVRDDPIKKEIAQLNLERRVIQSEIEIGNSILAGLALANEDPEAIVNISSDLTQRQPELNALKQELVKRKSEFAVLSGLYTSVHPKVSSASGAIRAMEGQIRLVLDPAVRDIKSQNAVQQARLDSLDSDIGGLRKRLFNLSDRHADSMTLVADVENKTRILNEARTGLAQINSILSSVDADLLIKVGEAQVSTRPDGLGKRQLVLAGGLCGLMLGLGLVMLLAPPMGSNSENPTVEHPPVDLPSEPSALHESGASGHGNQEAPTIASKLSSSSLSDLGLTNLKPVDWATVENEQVSDREFFPSPRTFADEPTAPPVSRPDPIPQDLDKTVANHQDTKVGIVAGATNLPSNPGSRKDSETKMRLAEPVISTASESHQVPRQSDQVVDIEGLVESLNDSIVEAEIERQMPAIADPPTSPDAEIFQTPKNDDASKPREKANLDRTALAELIRQARAKVIGRVPEIKDSTMTEEMLDQAFEDECRSVKRSALQAGKRTANRSDSAGEFGANKSFEGSSLGGRPITQERETVSDLRSDQKPHVDDPESKSSRSRKTKPRPASVRPASVRPVDLLKSVNRDATIVNLDANQTGQSPMTSPTGVSKKTTPASGPTVPVQKVPAKKIRMNVETAIAPVPDQVQKLRDSISNFVKPLVKPEENENDKF